MILSFKKLPVVEIQVELATRQFGGGHEAREVDLEQWLRPATVRGALRFWWRALFGGSHPTIREMLAAETRIFGAASSAGPLSVTAECKPAGQPRALELERGSSLGVAYFPAEQNNHAPAALLLDPGAIATVRLAEVPGPLERALREDEWAQVRASLAAWLVLGGNGARTRRAAGAVVPRSAGDAAKIGAPFDRSALCKWLRELPQSPTNVRPEFFRFDLREAVFVTRASADAATVTRQVLEAWRAVRQDRAHPASWAGASGWGRSRWPEADAIRLATGSHARWSGGVSHAPDPNHRGKAPRAHLGLPIGVKFKDTGPDRGHSDRGSRTHADPDKTELVARAGEKILDRYASPVLLSVARLSEGYAGIITVTPSALDHEVTMKSRPRESLTAGPWNAVRDRVLVHLRSRNDLEEL